MGVRECVKVAGGDLRACDLVVGSRWCTFLAPEKLCKAVRWQSVPLYMKEGSARVLVQADAKAQARVVVVLG